MEQSAAALEGVGMTLKHSRVLVTGATGFVGAHLVKQLVGQGARVYSTSISRNPLSYFFEQKLDRQSTVLQVDLCDFEKVKDIVSKFEIEYIFHLAAQPIVSVAYHNPRRTLESNVMGTVNILEAARLYQPKGVIVASSDKAYGKHGQTQYTEDAPLQGDHPYEVSKSAADLIAMTYAKTYGLPIVTSRFGNIYGPGDLNFSRIIPGIMESLVTNQTLELRSDGSMVRDYLHVEDVVRGYLLLAKKVNEFQGEAFNFGSDETLSVIETIHSIEKALKKKVKYAVLNNAKNEIPYQSLDYTKAKQKLGWTPQISINTSAKTIFKWYKQTLASRL